MVRVSLLVASLFTSALVCAVAAGPADPAGAHGHMHCNKVQGGPSEVGFGTFDPIVHPGMSNMGHEHMFFNNEAIFDPGQGANATYSYLTNVNNRISWCENLGDTAVYWIPAVYQINTGAPARLSSKASIFYYRSWEGRRASSTTARGRANPRFTPAPVTSPSPTTYA